VAWAGIATSVLALFALLPIPGFVRLLCVLPFATFGAGCALLCHAPPLMRATRRALVLTISLAIFTATSATMAWGHLWHPRAGLALLALAAAISCLVALRTAARPRRVRPSARLAPYRNRRTAIDAAVIAVALLCWAGSLGLTDIAKVGEYGFLGTVNPLFFLAPVLAIGGFVAELRRGARRVAVLLGYLLVVILVIHASTPTLLEVPQYAWTYRHLGVVSAFEATGRIGDTADVYQQWPGFFTAMAQLFAVTGIDPLGVARWFPVFANVAAALLVYALARELRAERRVAFGAVLAAQCLNWIAEDYFTPLALAYLLGLGALLWVLTFLRPGSTHRRWAWGMFGGLVTMLALAATHPVGGFVVAASVVGLVSIGVVRPWWIALWACAIPVAYLLPRAGRLDASPDLFGGFGLPAWGAAGPTFSAVVVRTLASAVAVAVVLALWRARRTLGRLLPVAILAVVPAGLVLAGGIGGDALSRAYLFALPWCALLVADLAARRRPNSTALTPITLAVGLSLALFATMQGRHGQLMVDRQTSASVDAAHYLYAHATPGAAIVLADPNFPARLAANYDEFNRGLARDPDLVTSAGLRGAELDLDYLQLVNRFVDSRHAQTAYLVVSDGMRRYASYFGVLPNGSLDSLERTLLLSGDWTVFYRNREVVIYERMAKQGKPTPSSGNIPTETSKG
jgi:hypothetical protein